MPQLRRGELFLLDVHQEILRLVGPVERAIGYCLPQLRLRNHLRQPFEVARDVEERGRRPKEVAVVILRSAHHQPGIVQKRVELLAGAESLLLGRRRFLARFLLDAVQLYGLFAFCDSRFEVALSQ